MKTPDFIQTILTGLKTSYALVDSYGRITACDPHFPAVGQSDSLPGLALTEVWPEVIGQEEALEKVRQGETAFFRLENVNRTGPSGDLRYLTLTIIAAPPDTGAALMALATDVTEQGLYLQQLMQSRNELRLARRKLAKLNDHLDYLLHHYLPPEVAYALLQGQLRPELGGELRQVSILFADIRGFTPLAEQLSPERVVLLLNDYLNIVAQAIDEVDGTISQFQGDNMMIMFNAPADQPDHARRAVQAGLALQQAVAAYQAQRPPNEPRLHFGVGINSGPALIGNIGALRRYTFTAIGDTINLAARITAAVPAGQVWISQTTHEQLEDAFTVEPLPPMKFKGKSEATPLFRVLSGFG